MSEEDNIVREKRLFVWGKPYRYKSINTTQLISIKKVKSI